MDLLIAAAEFNRTRYDPALDVVKIWAWERNEVIAEIPMNATSLAFDPSGTRLAVTPAQRWKRCGGRLGHG